MPETHLERIQRVVSNYDTEAGQKLRYHITRAQADEVYAEKIGFNPHFNRSPRETPTLDSLFIFQDMPEGHDYWWLVYIDSL